MLNPFKLNIDYSKRTYGLDVIRAIAIIEVVLVHASVFLKNIDTNFPWIPLIDGVEIFFILSGFLIGSILIRTFETRGISLPIIFSFFKRRWFRTLPNYYLILIVNIILVYFAVTNNDITRLTYKFFLFLQNFTGMFYGFFWESWSITIEEWFYLIFPLIILIGFFLLKRIKVKKLMLIGILLFMIVPFLLRISILNIEEFWSGVRMKGIVIYKLDSIAFGILGAYIKAYYKEFWFKYKNSLFILGLLLFYTYLYIDKQDFLMAGRICNNWIVSFCILLLFPKADSIKQGKTRFSKWITHLSLVSYSMYLINFGIVCQVITTNFMPLTPTSSIITYILYLIIVIGLSTLIYKYYEKPMMDLRDRPSKRIS